jgi:predicted porin
LDLRFETTTLNFNWTDYEEILKPGDFPGLNSVRSYDYDTWQVRLDNNTLETIQLKASYRQGTALNLVPQTGYLPSVADTNRIDLNVLVRPIDQLSIANTYFLTELETQSGTKIFSNEIVRSNWNYQFTKELSLRFIAQYDKTEAGPATRLKDDENLNFDVLLRYVINPWSAFYVGYNSNQSNFDIVDVEGERELIVANDLRRDGDQFFVKFSYLFQR